MSRLGPCIGSDPPLTKSTKRKGLSDIQLIYKLSIEVQSELIPGSATVVIQIDSELTEIYFL